MDTTLESLSNISLHNDNSVDFEISEENVHQQNDRERVIQELLKLYLRHNLTKVAVGDVAKLMNMMPGARVEIPTSKYLLFKEFMKSSPHKISRYIKCTKCSGYSRFEFGSDIANCGICNSDIRSEKISFIHLHLASQLRSIIVRYFDDIIDWKQKISNKNCTDIEDLYDGELLKKLLQTNLFIA